MPIYRGVTKIQIGDGSLALFWKDNWNQSIYAEQYLRGFSYTLNEDVSVKELLTAADLHTIFYLPLSIQAREELRKIQSEVATESALFRLEGG